MYVITDNDGNWSRKIVRMDHRPSVWCNCEECKSLHHINSAGGKELHKGLKIEEIEELVYEEKTNLPDES